MDYVTHDGQGKIARQTAHEVVLDRMRDAVIRGDFPAGTRLVISRIAEDLGVSTTPVREALRDLHSEGLVRMDAYKGAVVHSPGPTETHEIYNLRLALEPLAVEYAVMRITDEEIQRAHEIHRGMVRTEDTAHWVRMNRDFHGVFVQATRLPRLISILRSLQHAAAIHVGLSLQADPGQRDAANAEHGQLIAAYRERDSDQVLSITRHHLASTVQVIERRFSREEEGPR